MKTDRYVKEEDFDKILKHILSGPKFPGKEFVTGKYTYADVYSMAAGICGALPENSSNVCLFSEDKGITAAALLASAARGFSLVLPYACTVQAVEDISGYMDLQAAISDKPVELLPGISIIVPSCSKNRNPGLKPKKGPDDICFYFFTGGSTGRPKIWAKTPRNLFAEALFQIKEHKIGTDDCILATVPPYHIYGILYSVLVPFFTGARVVEKICTYPEEIRQAFSDYSPSIFVSVPVHYRVLNSSLDGNETGTSSLRLAFSSAGRLDEADGEYFYKTTGAPVVEIYGSTETGGIAARTRAKGETWLTPFDVIDWKIENERLCVRSGFISPGVETDDKGFFLTGDRVESGDGKHFVLLGRADGIVKVGGKRVDLEEAQEKLKQIEGVQDLVLIAVPGANGRENDICALVQAEQAYMDKDRFRACAVKLVSPYAMPRRIEIVDKIPVSDTGKYDRNALESLFN
ncbi:Aromatic amino acid lyase family protein [Desulfonema limicola]|uniref:Aromatic amino acid lyase family protein n=1 Tax=Desulfonema limicola TaxID=45656 RepID=A0A975B7L1_9BACT|nr:class I adenylate-forming enzyme family protein [Desulfonema limicola]QTA80123.1 Aromatic amino acid lyase family protein [Desulfonema limicola]